MKWIKAIERLPEVILGESETFFCRHVKNGRKVVLFYGKSSQSYLTSQPWNWEWLEEKEIQLREFVQTDTSTGSWIK